jgi:hypothetical protein
MAVLDDDLDLIDTTDLMRGVKDIDDAADAYEEADKYYRGDVDEVFASPQVRLKLQAETDTDAYRFNLAKTAVTALLNKVALAGISVTDNDEATEEIARIRRTNRMELIEPEVHKRAFVTGDTYVAVMPVYGRDDAGDPTDEVTGVRVFLHSPAGVRAVYGDDDPLTPIFVIKSWWEDLHAAGDDGGVKVERIRRADLYYPLDPDRTPYANDGSCRILRWVTRRGTAGATGAEWEPYLSDGQDLDDWVIDYPLGLPWFHFRTGLPYGVPEHADAYGPQNAVNKLLITQLYGTDSHGFPQRYGLLDAAAALDENHDDPDWGDDTDSDDTGTAAGGVSSGMRTGPGTMQTLTGMKEVGQWDPADPKVFIEPTDMYVRLMSQTTQTPLDDFDPSRDQPSGESRRRKEAPLVAKADNRLLYLTATWADLWRYALKLRGHAVDEVDVQWKPRSQITDTEGWQTLKLKHEMGVPLEQLLIEAGYTPEQAKTWAAEAKPMAGADGTEDGREAAEAGETDSAEGETGSDAQGDLDWGLFGATATADAP